MSEKRCFDCHKPVDDARYDLCSTCDPSVPDLEALVEKLRQPKADFCLRCRRDCADELEAALAAGGTLHESRGMKQLVEYFERKLRDSPYKSCRLNNVRCPGPNLCWFCEASDVLGVLAVERGTARTECCNVDVNSDMRFCPGCGWEFRAKVERGTAVEEVTAGSEDIFYRDVAKAREDERGTAAKKDEAIRYAEEGRQSHKSWADWLEHCETCDDCRASMPSRERLEREIGTLDEQREWVRKYDVILQALGAVPKAITGSFTCAKADPLPSAEAVAGPQETALISELTGALENFYAMVRGESPSLLEDDCNAWRAHEAIEKGNAYLASPLAASPRSEKEK